MSAFALPADLTLDTAVVLRRRALAALAASPAPWVVDAGALQTFDSAALACLLELRRDAPQQRLEVRAAPQRLRDLAAAYGLDFLFDAPSAHS
ncbi:MAG: STAS domain-containing protein [Burkholderiaceae bacterium]|jgi:phospholipid transport system transporter-binding protein|nr:STAS domain-containing protein [Burkholderiaceae bacterium]